jgi:hypothetical protein
MSAGELVSGDVVGATGALLDPNRRPSASAVDAPTAGHVARTYPEHSARAALEFANRLNRRCEPKGLAES